MEHLEQLLEKARNYEKEQVLKIQKDMRPTFHVSAPIGWINDPNGLSEFKNEYHLFFQYHPYSTSWGPMHWGHVKSKDLVKWEILPVALAPDSPYDDAGCFSGSAIDVNGVHILMYTGVSHSCDEDGNTQIEQVQCIASGGGVEYEKWKENPVITAKDIPFNCSKEDFRDPKIWEHNGTYYVVAASRSEDKSGQIVLFQSENLKDWTFRTVLAKCEHRYGKMWECPDFFSLGDKHILVLSPQDMQAKGLEFYNGNHAIYFSGTFDYETCRFKEKIVKSLDYGLDFYAPQTMETADGRRIMIAWMKSWDTNFMPEETNWNGMMTVPRELNISEYVILQNPVKEIENYYKNQVLYEDVSLSGSQQLDGMKGRVLDMTIYIKSGNYKKFVIELAKNDSYCITCTFFPDKGEFTFDRTYSGLNRDVPCSRTMKVQNKAEDVTIRILLDKYSAEIFINNGEQVMSNTFFTPLEANDIVFDVEGILTADINMHEICV